MPNRIFAVVFMALFFGFGSGCVAPVQTRQAARKQVFAHYMVCFATYGPTVEGYQREIREAQAAGIDGFALNVGAWSKEPHYIERSALIFQAAKELGTDFKLFFSMDQHVLEDLDDLRQIVRTYASHPNQLHHQGKTVVSTFGGGGVAWREKVFEPLRQEGINLFFVPFFYPQPYAMEVPDRAIAEATVARHAEIVDGMFYFGAAGTPEQLAQGNENCAAALRAWGKLVMASVTPYYWGTNQPDRRYFETRGGQGLQVQWEKIMQIQPDWVEIVTWNDFGESYLCPAPDTNQDSRVPTRKSHAGYLEMCKPYIAWFKTGRKPRIGRDAIFYVYRTHPKDAVATNEGIKQAPQPINPNPVKQRHGDVRDDLYLTLSLTAPGELRVDSGGTASVHPVPAGTTHVQVPFRPGPQRFELFRDGKRVLTLEGVPIVEKPRWYDFSPATGFVYGP